MVRSWLFVPGNREDLIQKAARFAPDVVVLDLEDSVPEEVGESSALGRDADESAKQAARRIIGGITAQTQQEPPVVVRTRGANTGALRGDLEAVVGPGLSAVFLPQANEPTDVAALDTLLTELEHSRGLTVGSIGIVATPESALGIKNAFDTFTSSPRIIGAGFAGAEGGDLTQDLGVRSPLRGDELQYAKSRLLLEARAARVPHIIDGVFPGLDSEDAFTEDSRGGWRLGYTGRMAINPMQVRALNRLYSPSPYEIAEAKEILAALSEGAALGQGSVRYKGRLLDVAWQRAAEAVLAAGSASRADETQEPDMS